MVKTRKEQKAEREAAEKAKQAEQGEASTSAAKSGKQPEKKKAIAAKPKQTEQGEASISATASGKQKEKEVSVTTEKSDIDWRNKSRASQSACLHYARQLAKYGETLGNKELREYVKNIDLDKASKEDAYCVEIGIKTNELKLEAVRQSTEIYLKSKDIPLEEELDPNRVSLPGTQGIVLPRLPELDDEVWEALKAALPAGSHGVYNQQE